MTLKFDYRYPSREMRRAWANKAGIFESADGTSFECPQCYALIEYADFGRALMHHMYKHSTPEEADGLLKKIK
jgi:hypothetical protein